MNPIRTSVSVIVASAALACSAASHAQFNAVAYVDSQGRQWRQLDTSCGLTWNQVAALCPVDGVTRCTGTINNQSITGWVWATRAQVQQLLVELGAGVGTPDCSSSTTATGQVFAYFHSTTNADLSSIVDGWTSTVSTAPATKGFVFTPTVRLDQDSGVGYTCSGTVSAKSWSSTDRGVWLFRPPCAADLNADGAVGPADLSVLLGAWGTGGAADLNQNGIVGAEDLSILLASWGAGGC